MARSTTFNASSADDYERLMGRWSRLLAVPFLDFAGVSDGDQVLDVGCGTGSLTFAAARHAQVARIVGVDLAPAYLERARQAGSDARITFLEGEAYELPVDDDSFDRVFSFLVLQFIPDPARAIAEMRRKAKPGGVVAAAVWDARGGLVFNRMFFDTAAALIPRAEERRKGNYTRPMTRPGELADAWRAAGLQHIDDTMLTIRMVYENFADYWAPFEGKDGPGAALMADLSAADRALVKDKVRSAYLDGEVDGPRSYAATAWAVKGIAP